MTCVKKYFVVSLLGIAMQSMAIAAPNADWHGYYVGTSTGVARARFDAKTTTQAGSLLSPTQANAINSAGNQVLAPNGFLAGITGGYNWQVRQVVIGIEGDLQSLSINETTHSGAILPPGFTQYVVTSYGNNNWLMTIRPRLGLVTQGGLLYATGGWAVTTLQSDFLFSSDSGKFESRQVKQLQSGYVLGAGFETGLTRHISVKIEYLFTNFGTATASSMRPPIPSGQFFSNSVSLKENIWRLGINYHFDDASSSGLSPQLLPLLFATDKWQVEIGVRPFYSTGNVGSPQPLLNSPGDVLASRLIFKNLNAIALETYTRIDYIKGFFVKGLIGGGTISNGQLNDEDFPAGGAYSNTLSQASGNLSYGTADVGYSLWNTNRGKSGLFVGYNYYAQNVNVYGCRQLAGASVCQNSSTLNKFMGISEEDNYKSLRLGIVSQFDITNQLGFTAEAAYLPVVTYSGQDNHNARQLIGPEQSNSGDGSMLEATLSYQLTDTWNIGLGARYWMWNMHGGVMGFDFIGDDMPINEPARYNTYRYGAFLQLQYLEKPIDHFYWTESTVAWRGFYVGGGLGGAWGNSAWSDPFGPLWTIAERVNAAGFGDTINVNGPLGEVDMHYYWQLNKWVWGVGGAIGVADIRGDNSLFTGLGGINGQVDANRFITLTGRLGTTYDRSLFYINVGPALLNTRYRLNANNNDQYYINDNAVTLGTQSTSLSRWGVTLGAGIDYALTDHWITNVEYDYMRVRDASLSFSDIAIINEHHFSVKQTMNMFKVGISYKFGA